MNVLESSSIVECARTLLQLLNLIGLGGRGSYGTGVPGAHQGKGSIFPLWNTMPHPFDHHAVYWPQSIKTVLYKCMV